MRTRTYLVESAAPPVVQLACIDDDAQGEPLEVVWDLELDGKILGDDVWKSIGAKGFDSARFFSAYMHTLRWRCVTATDPKLFQAPFRAGIRLDAYQLEPLRKALRLPRVNLFIADDVGLGKTVEAGLIASELLLRRRVNDIVVACPPSMLTQWKDELEQRFGLVFEILDRDYVERIRQVQGFGVNPWKTFPRFIVSHKLLIDEAYAAPLRDYLDNLRPGSLLILDEAHHAAPASGAKYAIDSKFTQAVRELAGRFEHRIFLSATPHNGHSNSFSALLEILDAQRFVRGVPIRQASLRDIMVRRLKEDVRNVVGGFPERKIEQVTIEGLPVDAPELQLSRLLDEYAAVRGQRMEGATKRKQAQAALVVTHLQQRLLSSIEAFARTLAVHRRSMEKLWAALPDAEKPAAIDEALLTEALDADDDRSSLPEEEQLAMLDREIEKATLAATPPAPTADVARERALLDEMAHIAEKHRATPDARVRELVQWIRKHMCAGAAVPYEGRPTPEAAWTNTRLLIFTEYEDTKRYLVEMLRQAIYGTNRFEERIEVFHGPTPKEKRDAIKRAFNMPPSEHPMRILVATDAAREGLNLQAHCHNLFHFDLPWNPSRLEQRNGRIDRKLQPAPKVFCHYFFYAQRPEDRILRTLVRKTDTIHRQLGSLAQVLDGNLAKLLEQGIRHQAVDQLDHDIETENLDADKRTVTEEELEAARERQDDLKKQIDVLRTHLENAREWIGLETKQLRDTLSCALEMGGAKPLRALAPQAGGQARFALPDLAADAGWAATLDTLRAPPEDGKKNFQWRREAPIRPVVFEAPPQLDEDTVQLHLAHRVVQRLLGRFTAQGFVHFDLSRACLAQAADAIPRVVLLGRLALFGPGAVRLHEEILTVTARWTEPSTRKKALAPYAREAEAKTMQLLEDALRPGKPAAVAAEIAARLQAALTQDIDELLPHLAERGRASEAEAAQLLKKRGAEESAALREVLLDQKKRVLAKIKETEDVQYAFDFNTDERRQLDTNRKHWAAFLKNVDGDLEHEPPRIEQFYTVTTSRIEPLGIAYLWPVSG